MKDKAHPTIPMFWWYTIFVVLFVWSIVLTALPGLTQALQRADIFYYLFLLIPAVVTILAVRDAWNYLTHQ
jgi:hypothetical protein